MAQGLSRRGWSVTLHRLRESFPFPDAAALAHAGERLAALPEQALAMVDGLAYGAMPREAMAHAARLRLVALVHHPLALESGLDADAARGLALSERRALAAARHVITTSRHTAATLVADYRVPAPILSVVEPGTDPAPAARGSGGPRVRLLCVATFTPRKGHALLLDALARLASDGWCLVCAGSAERDPDTAAALRRQIQDLGLSARVTLLGELDRETLTRCYLEADAFVLPTSLEGYGMALAEAMAHGLPVVSTRAGAVPDTVGEQAGLLVPPGDVEALATALSRVVADAPLRARLAAGARARAAQLPTWEDAAAALDRVLTAVMAR